MDILAYLHSLIITAENSADENIKAFGHTLDQLLTEAPTVLPALMADAVNVALAAAAKDVPLLSLAITLEPGIIDPAVRALTAEAVAVLTKALAPANPPAPQNPVPAASVTNPPKAPNAFEEVVGAIVAGGEALAKDLPHL